MPDDGDFKTSAWNIAVDDGASYSDVIVKPPIWILAVAFSFALISALTWFLEANRLGYVVGVLGSGSCIFAAAADKRRQANLNYSSFGWFSPGTRAIRWSSTLLTLLHIAQLARNAGK